MNHTIPDSLVRYQRELDEAIRRDLAGAAVRRGRRRVGVRLALAGGAAVAVVLGAVSLLVRGVPSTAPPAAAAIIHQAATALSHAPGKILHIKFTVTQDNGDGTTVSWTQESFSEQRPPYDTLLVNERLPGTPQGVQQATLNGVSQVYDPTRNTIYIDRPQPRRNVYQYRFSPGPTPNTDRVSVPTAYRVRLSGPTRGHPIAVRRRTVIVTDAQAKALRAGTDMVTFKRHGNRVTDARIVPNPDSSSGNDTSTSFRGRILALLRSGHARVAGHATVDGRDTIKIESAGGHTTYYLAPGSYTPVELTTRGTTGGTVTRFETYQTLPLQGNNKLLSLSARHPTAITDRSAGAYNAADERLFPHG